MSAMQAYSYAKVRTDRTPENKQSTTQFMWVVSMISVAVTVVIVHLVEKHVSTSKAYAAIKEIDFPTTIDGVVVSLADQMDDFVDS